MQTFKQYFFETIDSEPKQSWLEKMFNDSILPIFQNLNIKVHCFFKHETPEDERIDYKEGIDFVMFLPENPNQKFYCDLGRRLDKMKKMIHYGTKFKPNVNGFVDYMMLSELKRKKHNDRMEIYNWFTTRSKEIKNNLEKAAEMARTGGYTIPENITQKYLETLCFLSEAFTLFDLYRIQKTIFAKLDPELQDKDFFNFVLTKYIEHFGNSFRNYVISVANGQDMTEGEIKDMKDLWRYRKEKFRREYEETIRKHKERNEYI